jgi:hypothetical protein
MTRVLLEVCKSIMLLMLLFGTSTTMAQEPHENRWLREQFSISFRSLSTCAVLERIESDDPIRKAVWDYPLAQLIADMSPGLPLDARVTRTFLRCKSLGWHYGGHTIDVISIPSIDFEGLLAKKGVFLKAMGERGMLKARERNMFMLPDPVGSKVAAICLPGGYEGTSDAIARRLEQALISYLPTENQADWCIWFTPELLLDPYDWSALSRIIEVASQPRDSESNIEGRTRVALGKLLNLGLSRFASDTERCEVSATFHQQDSSGTIRVVLQAKRGSRLAASFHQLAQHQVCQSLPEIDSSLFLVRGLTAIHSEDILSDDIQRRGDAGFWGASQTDPVTHHLVGITNSQPRHMFVAACRSPQGVATYSGSEVQSAFAIKLTGAPEIRRFSPQQPHEFQQLCYHLQALRTAAKTPEDAGDDTVNAWMVGQVDLAPFVDACFPDSGIVSNANSGVIDVIARAENHRLILSFKLPPQSERYVYLAFEQVLHTLQAIGKFKVF